MPSNLNNKLATQTKPKTTKVFDVITNPIMNGPVRENVFSLHGTSHAQIDFN